METDGTVKILGGEQRLRTSTLIRQSPIQGESHLHFLGESEGRPEQGEEQEILQGKTDELDFAKQLQDDSMRNDEEAKDDFWRSQENALNVITFYTESHCKCRKKKHFLFRWSTSTLPEQHTRHWT